MAHHHQHGSMARDARRRGEEYAMCATCGWQPGKGCMRGHPHTPENRASNGPGKTYCKSCRADVFAIRRRTKCKTPVGRFIASFETSSSGCWQWTGAIADTRYGTIGWKGRSVLAHRLSYQLFIGSIPDGLELDHLCRNRGCVNPTHLEPVTHLVNIRRSMSPTCKRGHSRSDPANGYVRPGNGFRMCRPCMVARQSGVAV